MPGDPRTVAPLPRAWAELAANVNGRVAFGQKGARDPDAFCEDFDPVDGIDWLGVRVTAPGTGRCDSDGHYLCLGCSHLSARRIAEVTEPDEPVYPSHHIFGGHVPGTLVRKGA